MVVHSPIVERIGGYPRLWFADGHAVDFDYVVPDAEVAEYEAWWRRRKVRVEWLRSPHGRLDAVLPQTLERAARNANVRSWAEREIGY